MSPYIGLFFDVIVLGALIATIFHAMKLSRQFKQMQDDKRAFEALISALNVAASRAEAAIGSMKEAATDSGTGLQDKITKARGMAEELEIMVQAGDNLADRLNKLATESRKAAPPPAFAADDSAADDTQKQSLQPRSRAEKELLEALKAKQKG
jgi:hypothetical protein